MNAVALAASGSTAREHLAFSAMDGVAAQNDMDGLAGLLADTGSALGLKTVTVYAEPPRGTDRAGGYLIAHDAEFLRAHSESPAFDADPVRSRARQQPRPFVWSLDWHRRSDGLAPLVAAFEERGIDAGFLVPIYGPMGLRGTVGFAGSARELADDRTQAFLFMLSLQAFDRVQDLATPKRAQGPKVTLAPREIECLHWTAAGKTSWEIGEILSLSERTVESYLKTAALKLGAVTRTQAVAAAIRQGLIL